MSDELPHSAYRELITHTVDILTVFDDSGVIQYESPSVRRVVGYQPEELVGESVFEYIHPDDRQEALEMFYEAVETSGSLKIPALEFRFRHKDGSWVWLEARGKTTSSPALDGYVISSRDISDRKEYEQRLKQERDRLDQFASIVSHDLRNPLQVAEGQLELAREECQSDHLDRVARAVDRIDELIDDLLTLSRTGNHEVQLTTVTLREIVTESWETVYTKNATLDVETEQAIRADRSQVQQVLENLFSNAIEHGGEDVTVTVGTLEDGFYVADDGLGISEDARHSLLEYGFSTKTDGTGFGLNIVNQIVKNHGWSLDIAEGQDGGARFEITGVEISAD